MTDPKDLLDSVAFSACECGFGHCHIVSTGGEITKNAEVEKSEAFAIVGSWQYVELALLDVPANEDAATWVYFRCDEQGQHTSEVVQFVSLRPVLIRTKIVVH
jgi:hypothetical protein